MLTLLILEGKNHKKWEHKCVFATLARKIINFMEKGLQQLMWWGQRGHKHFDFVIFVCKTYMII